VHREGQPEGVGHVDELRRQPLPDRDDDGIGYLPVERLGDPSCDGGLRVGVIGPTRMAYERVIPVVDIAARMLGSALNSRD
jgi:hypothetical protein